MAKKMKAAKDANDMQMVDAVRNSAHQIWQAGLGALAKAQQDGSDTFAKLAKEGASVQQRTQHLAEEKLFGVSQTVARLADNLGRQATGSWERLGSAFEERLSRSLHSLGIPTQNDIHALTMQIAELNKSVDALLGRDLTTSNASGKASQKKAVAKATRKPVAEAAPRSSSMARGTRASRKMTGTTAGQV